MTVETGGEQPTIWWRAGRFDPLADLETLAATTQASEVNVEDIERREETDAWDVGLRCQKCGTYLCLVLRWDEAAARLPDIVAPAHHCVGGQVVSA
jgi:hypothetical protein